MCDWLDREAVKNILSQVVDVNLFATDDMLLTVR